jgi:hypothetical protein
MTIARSMESFQGRVSARSTEADQATKYTLPNAPLDESTTYVRRLSPVPQRFGREHAVCRFVLAGESPEVAESQVQSDAANGATG